MKVSASATVILTIEVNAVGAYGADWKLEDLHKQVAREAEAAVTNQLNSLLVRIIGKPRVKACTFEAS